MRPDTAVTPNVVRLVLGVARLGENDLRGWWKGHAIDRTGQYVLSSMFRRTWKPAALELDVAAASRMHQELLGRSTALHLGGIDDAAYLRLPRINLRYLGTIICPAR